MTDPLLYTQGMTDSQKMMFLSEYNQRRKDGTTGLLLALFLGGAGAHRFYMGQVGLGLLYLCFCWFFFLPSIIGFFEAFAMNGRVARYNEQIAMDVAAKVKALGGPATTAAIVQ